MNKMTVTPHDALKAAIADVNSTDTYRRAAISLSAARAFVGEDTAVYKSPEHLASDPAVIITPEGLSPHGVKIRDDLHTDSRMRLLLDRVFYIHRIHYANADHALVDINENTRLDVLAEAMSDLIKYLVEFLRTRCDGPVSAPYQDAKELLVWEFNYRIADGITFCKRQIARLPRPKDIDINDISVDIDSEKEQLAVLRKFAAEELSRDAAVMGRLIHNPNGLVDDPYGQRPKFDLRRPVQLHMYLYLVARVIAESLLAAEVGTVTYNCVETLASIGKYEHERSPYVQQQLEQQQAEQERQSALAAEDAIDVIRRMQAKRAKAAKLTRENPDTIGMSTAYTTPAYPNDTNVTDDDFASLYSLIGRIKDAYTPSATTEDGKPLRSCIAEFVEAVGLARSLDLANYAVLEMTPHRSIKSVRWAIDKALAALDTRTKEQQRKDRLEMVRLTTPSGEEPGNVTTGMVATSLVASFTEWKNLRLRHGITIPPVRHRQEIAQAAERAAQQKAEQEHQAALAAEDAADVMKRMLLKRAKASRLTRDNPSSALSALEEMEPEYLRTYIVLMLDLEPYFSELTDAIHKLYKLEVADDPPNMVLSRATTRRSTIRNNILDKIISRIRLDAAASAKEEVTYCKEFMDNILPILSDAVLFIGSSLERRLMLWNYMDGSDGPSTVGYMDELHPEDERTIEYVDNIARSIASTDPVKYKHLYPYIQINRVMDKIRSIMHVLWIRKQIENRAQQAEQDRIGEQQQDRIREQQAEQERQAALAAEDAADVMKRMLLKRAKASRLTRDNPNTHPNMHPSKHPSKRG